MDVGYWIIGNGQQTMVRTQWAMDIGDGTLDNGQWTIDKRQWTISYRQWTLDD